MKALAAIGLLDAIEASSLDVFPDCWQSLHLFSMMRTQWRYVSGIGGVFATGLDYGVLRSLWDIAGIAEEDRDWVFADIQLMEGAAIAEMNKKKD